MFCRFRTLPWNCTVHFFFSFLNVKFILKHQENTLDAFSSQTNWSLCLHSSSTEYNDLCFRLQAIHLCIFLSGCVVLVSFLEEMWQRMFGFNKYKNDNTRSYPVLGMNVAGDQRKIEPAVWLSAPCVTAVSAHHQLRSNHQWRAL